MQDEMRLARGAHRGLLKGSALRLAAAMALALCAPPSLLSAPSESAANESAPCENSPLLFGNPSAASGDDRDNLLMEKSGYALSYNDGARGPNWAAWHLCAADLGGAKRSDAFRADDSLPEGFYRVRPGDYMAAAFGFDRGHLCPSADRTASAEANRETFLMTNMVPQAPDNNRRVWQALERYERRLAQWGNELYIFAGPSGEGGVSDKGEFAAIEIPERDEDGNVSRDMSGAPAASGMKIAVGAFTWKIILVLPEGCGDVSRVTKGTDVIAVRVPNAQGCHKNASWQDYITTVDAIEEETGFDFFQALDDETEREIEARKYKW